MLTCPKCQNKELIIRREVSYVYSYVNAGLFLTESPVKN